MNLTLAVKTLKRDESINTEHRPERAGDDRWSGQHGIHQQRGPQHQEWDRVRGRGGDIRGEREQDHHEPDLQQEIPLHLPPPVLPF